MANLLFGTSGWSYKEWVGPFYEKEKNMFSHYARFFDTAEINSTFYKYPSAATIYGLDRNSPRDFVFSAKLPKLLTHEKRLDPDQKVENDLLRFLELFNPLKARGKLGCILIQLPPRFIYEHDHDDFEAFLELLPQDYEFAAEFRHHSWLRDETWKMLERRNVAYCIVDEPLLPPEVHVTAGFAYFRWHGRGTRPWYDYCYSQNELGEWLPRIEEAKGKTGKLYGYFNNHYHGYAVENCLEILEMLGAARPDGVRVKERIRKQRTEKKPLVYESKLDQFGFETARENIDALLLKLTNKARLERGIEIDDGELFVEETPDGVVRARIREYTIELDPEEKVLRHDCDDYRKGLGIKRICKHIAKLFMSLRREKADEILRDMIQNKDDWTFQLT